MADNSERLARTVCGHCDEVSRKRQFANIHHHVSVVAITDGEAITINEGKRSMEASSRSPKRSARQRTPDERRVDFRGLPLGNRSRWVLRTIEIDARPNEINMGRIMI